jgi:hypothetical protein
MWLNLLVDDPQRGNIKNSRGKKTLERTTAHCFCPCQHLHVPSPSHDHIARWQLVEHSPSILNAPTFCIHVSQATAHKDILHQTIFNHLVMNRPALFKPIWLALAFGILA